METKELKITIPENHEIDWQESAKQEKIVFKKKDTKPRSWEEYYKNNEGKRIWYINETSDIDTACLGGGQVEDENTLPTKELAEAFLAMMQLMSLRQAWIGNWEPDWKNRRQCKYCITLFENNEVMIDENIGSTRSLSFPTREMVEDFMNTFKDLLEVAKPLI